MAEDFVIVDDGARSIRLYNPVGFDPRKYLPERLWKHADSVRYFVHTIHHQRFMYRRAKDDFIEVKQAYMLPFFTMKDDYQPIMKALATKGVLECDGYYIKGQKSYGFRLGPTWRSIPFKAIRVSDPALVRKVLDKRQKDYASITWDVHRYLRAWTERLDFDYEAAVRHAVRCGLEEYEPMLDALRHRELYFTHCDYGRVHHNFSSLKSEFRRFLSYRGQKLVNLDIRNSQPLLFSVVLLSYLLGEEQFRSLYAWKVDNSGLYYDLPSSIFLQEEEPQPTPPPTPPLRLPGLVTKEERHQGFKDTTRRMMAHGLPQDVLLYLELTQRGQFYEYLMQEGGIAQDHRDEFKQSFFGGVFFCKNWPLTKQAKLFRRLFPSVYEVIHEIKKRDHRTLAHMLQRTESSLIINRIARRCMEELPDTCIVTIHDSVMTTPGGVEPVKAIMKQEFAQVGLEPTVSEN